MGLAISTFEYAYCLKEDPESAEWLKEDLELINEILRKNGYAVHAETDNYLEVEMLSVDSFPYSFLHYLRRIFALDMLGMSVTPANGTLSEKDDEIIDKASELLNSHLLCHSDAEGYYVPVAFDEVIFNDNLTGVMLCSSQKLFSEILKIAHHIDIQISDQQISSDMKQVLAECDESHPYYIERVVWFSLFEHCKNSIEHKTLITFG